MTTAVLQSAPMRALLFSSPPCDALKKAVMSLDQLTLMVHDKFNARFESSLPPVAKKPNVCSYCKGSVAPVNKSMRTCPKMQEEG